MKAIALAIALCCAAVAAADSGLISEAVVCRSVSPKGQPVSPAAWFPAGTTSLTLWFRTHELSTEVMRGEVHWLLGNTTLTTKEVTLRSASFGSCTYSLPMDEPLPAGSYQAVISVGTRPETKVVVRVGGKGPVRSASKAVVPESEAPGGSGGLKRSARTEDTGSPARLSPSATTGRLPGGAQATRVEGVGIVPPPLPSAVGPEVAVAPDDSGAADTGAPTAPAVPSAADAGPAEPAAASAPDVPPTPASVHTATGGEAGVGSPSTVDNVPRPVVVPAPPRVGSGGLEGAVEIATVGGPPTGTASFPAPPIGATRPSGSAVPTGAAPEAAEVMEPTGPTSTPLGPRSSDGTGPRPLVERPRVPAGSTPTQRAGTSPDPRPSPTGRPSPLVRPRPASQAAVGAQAPGPAQPKPALRTAAQLPQETDTEATEDVTPTAPVLRPPPSEAGSESTQQPSGTETPAPDELPSPATGTITTPPEGGGGAPADTPPTTGPAEAPAATDAPTAPEPGGATETPAPDRTQAAETPAPDGTTEAPDPGTVESTAPPVEMPDVLSFQGPLVVDAIAEDLPPLELSDKAVELHRVELVRPDDPISRPGIEPYWVLRIPDGRLWPPGLPHQFPICAGPEPTPNPEELLLYSDHIDGIMPLYDVPLAEARLHMAREDQSSLLSVSREMYDERRPAWEARAAGWHWLWYIRDMDLNAGDVVVSYLGDAKRSRRVPDDFEPTATEFLSLLDEQGQRVEPRAFDDKSAQAVSVALGERLKDVSASDPASLSGEARQAGLLALTMWCVPKTGRYQLWGGLPFDRCQAQSLVWVSPAP